MGSGLGVGGWGFAGPSLGCGVEKPKHPSLIARGTSRSSAGERRDTCQERTLSVFFGFTHSENPDYIPLLRTRTIFRSKVDELVPDTQHDRLRTNRQPKCTGPAPEWRPKHGRTRAASPLPPAPPPPACPTRSGLGFGVWGFVFGGWGWGGSGLGAWGWRGGFCGVSFGVWGREANTPAAAFHPPRAPRADRRRR